LLQAGEENDDIAVFLPQEGAPFVCDDLCIPKDAKEVELAHSFINFVTDPEIAAANMEWAGRRAPNKKARAQLSEDFRGSEVLFPPDEVFAKCGPFDDLADKLPLWAAEWQKVKAG